MSYYEFVNYPLYDSSESALDNISDYFDAMASNNIMIISGPVLERYGVVKRVKSALQEKGKAVRLVYTDVPRDSSIEVVKEIVRQIIANNIDGIVAVGGGSVLDSAKSAKLMCNDTAVIDEFRGGIDAVKRALVDLMPLVCIPTTTGTGSEATKVVVIYDEVNQVKTELVSSELIPEISVLSKEFLDTLPPKQVFFTAMDALTHAAEALTSLEKNPLSESFALCAVYAISEYLDSAMENDIDAKFELLKAACFSGTAFSNSMVGLCHAIAHSLGAVVKIPHDIACALLLPSVLRFNAEIITKEYSESVRILKNILPVNDFNGLIDVLDETITEKCGEYGVGRKLGEYGVNEETIREIVNKAYRDGARLTNARVVCRDDIELIIRNLL